MSRDSVEDESLATDERDAEGNFICDCGFCYWCIFRFCTEHGLPVEDEPPSASAPATPADPLPDYPEHVMSSWTARYGADGWRS